MGHMASPDIPEFVATAADLLLGTTRPPDRRRR
jgi:hypothetical protein